MSIKIPREARIAATLAIESAWVDCNSSEQAAIAAIAAAIEAWPRATCRRVMERTPFAPPGPALILPLKETGE